MRDRNANSATAAGRRRAAGSSAGDEMSRFRSYFANLTVGIAVSAPDTGWIEVNDKFCEIVGYTREELDSVTWPELTHPDDVDRNIALHREALAGSRDAYELEKRIVRKDGAHVHVHMTIRFVADDVAGTGHFIATCEDMTRRVMSNRELERQRRLFEAVFNYVPNPLLVTTMDRVIRMVNPAFNETFGWTADHVIGKSMSALYADEGEFARLGRIRFNEGAVDASVPDEAVFRRANGERFTAEVRGGQIRDPDGRVLGALGVVHDLTDRRRVEEELRESERRFRDFAASTSDYYWEMDENLRFSHFSERFSAVTGIDPEDMLGRTRRALGRGEIEDRRWRRYLDDLEAHRPFRDLVRPCVHRDGRVVHFSISGVPIFDETGRFRGYRGTGTDVTQRVLAEQALHESEERFRNLIEGSIQGISIFGFEWEIRFVNQAFAAIFGYDGPDQVLALGAGDALLAPEERERLRRFTRARRRGEPAPAQYEFRGIRRDGSRIDLHILVRPIVWQGEAAIQGTLVDLTEQKQAGRALRRLNEELERRVAERSRALEAVQQDLVRNERLAALGQLMGTVSHELRNPLGTIGASAAALRGQVPDPGPRLERTLARIERNVERCDRIIGELLAFGRSPDLERTRTDLGRWVHAVLDEQDLPEPVRLIRDVDSGVTAFFDPERLRQVLVNLLQNACQAIVERDGGGAGEVRIGCRASGRRVEVSVTDDGPGIPDGARPRIFEPLFSTRGFGVGLGLSLVKRIVEQHGGGVEVETGAAGTTMTLWLPPE